ncbi:MAG: diacylglycerol/polyprenol kinase family protein [Pseudanabaena sp. ELA607]|jgi:phytol kinase
MHWTHVLASLFNDPLALTAFQVGIVGAWLGLVFGGAALAHLWRWDGELVRKVVHIGVGNVVPLAWWLQLPGWLCTGAGLIFTLLALVAQVMPILPMLDNVKRKTHGVFYYALSITILVTIFWGIGQPVYAAIGVMVMTWGDGMAALVGQRFGRHGYVVMGKRRSWEGSLAMAGVSYLCILALLAVVPSTTNLFSILGGAIMTKAAAVAIIAAILEAVSPGGLDNLLVPLVIAGLSYWWL